MGTRKTYIEAESLGVSDFSIAVILVAALVSFSEPDDRLALVSTASVFESFYPALACRLSAIDGLLLEVDRLADTPSFLLIGIL